MAEGNEGRPPNKCLRSICQRYGRYIQTSIRESEASERQANRTGVCDWCEKRYDRVSIAMRPQSRVIVADNAANSRQASSISGLPFKRIKHRRPRAIARMKLTDKQESPERLQLRNI